MTSAPDKAIRIISEKGGTIRTTDALNSGIHPRTLYELRDSGVLETVARGVYRLADLPPLGDPDLALPRAARYPVVHEVPLKVYRYSNSSYEAGVMDYDIGGAIILTFNPEKTIADCFKYRNKLGIDLVTEALSLYRRRSDASLQKILKYARINRVEKQIHPYLEAVV